jgi:hypothetical protein
MCASSEDLLTLRAKLTYRFNLRESSRCFTGVYWSAVIINPKSIVDGRQKAAVQLIQLSRPFSGWEPFSNWFGVEI